MFIEYTSGERYEKIVLAQQQYDSTIIPFQRGDIVDSKGTVLATSVDVYNVILDCKVLNANDDAVVSATVDAVVSCFPEIQRETIETQLQDNPDSQYVVLAKQVSYDEMKSFTDMQEQLDNDGVADNEIVGVWFEKEYKRNYPYGSLASAVLGFTTSGNSGVIGLENQYNSKFCQKCLLHNFTAVFFFSCAIRSRNQNSCADGHAFIKYPQCIRDSDAYPLCRNIISQQTSYHGCRNEICRDL